MRTVQSAGACPLPAAQERRRRRSVCAGFCGPGRPGRVAAVERGGKTETAGLRGRGPREGVGELRPARWRGGKEAGKSAVVRPSRATAPQHRPPASRQLQSAPRGGRPPPRRCEGGWRWRGAGGGGAARGGRREEAAPAAHGAAPRRRRLGRLIGPCPAGRRRDRGCMLRRRRGRRRGGRRRRRMAGGHQVAAGALKRRRGGGG